MTNSYRPQSDELSIERKTSLMTHSMRRNHFHNVNEMYYMSSGRKKYFIADKSYLLQQGSLVLIPAYELHKSVNIGQQQYKGYLINFSNEFLEKQNNGISEIVKNLSRVDNKCFEFNKNESLLIEQIISKLLYEQNHKGLDYLLYTEALVEELMICIHRKAKDNTQFKHINPMHKRVSEIAKYIEQHYKEPVTLKSLSGEFHISTFYICKIFKEVSGFSVNEYLSAVRLREAQNQLKNSNLSIIQIAENCGFGSISNFGRLFKSSFGVSPLQFRKNI